MEEEELLIAESIYRERARGAVRYLSLFYEARSAESMAAVGNNIVRFTYTGAEGGVIPRDATHVFVDVRVVRRYAFFRHPNIVIEVICHEDVETIEADAFCNCPSLKRVIMPGVKLVLRRAHSIVVFP